MRVTSIDLSAPNGIVVTLSFRDPASTNPYIARDITGLDADEFTKKFYGVSKTKVKYYDMSLKPREVAIRIALNPQFDTGKSYSDLRDDLYRVIGSSRSGLINLKFKDGANVVATIDGYVNKLEAAHFSNVPEVQLTVKCDDPVLRAPSQISFPPEEFVKDSVISDRISTAPHGFYFTVIFKLVTPTFTIAGFGDEWSFVLKRPIEPFIIDDKLYFSSDNRNKYVYMMRAGVQTMLADSIMPGSIWPIIFPGDNKFSVDNSHITWNSISYYHTYWGV